MAAWPWRTNKRAPSGAKDVADLVSSMTALSRQLSQGEQALARNPVWDQAIFGPSQPIPSEPLDPGQVEPRIWQYPVAWNVPGTRPDRMVPWETLKRAAEAPLFRSCIEIRKTQISTLDWGVGISPKYAARMALESGKSERQVESSLRKEFQDEIDRLEAFWACPDKQQGRDFSSWVSALLEEYLVWDAVAIYPRKTYGGDTLDFRLIDGSTIKPLLDNYGARPEAPFPAYQQILYGFPRGEYQASVTRDKQGRKVIEGAYAGDQLVYKRWNDRVWTPYGYSPTEQALLDGLLWNKRFNWIMAEYTEGVTPAEWLITKQETGWTPEQLQEYERFINDKMAGQTKERLRNPMLPYGIEPARSAQVAERYKPDYDLFLIKLAASHYDVTMPELGFSEPGGLGSTGYHEGEEDIQYRKAILPTSRRVADFNTYLQKTYLDAPDALEFRFFGLDNEDEASADQILHNQMADGRLTLNQALAKMGEPAASFPEADMNMMQTQRGMAFISGASKLAPPGILIEPASEKPDVEDPEGGAASPAAGSAKPGNAAKPIKPAVGPQEPSKEALAELAKYKKWLARHPEPGREFEFELAETAELVKAGGAAPKGSSSASRSPYSQPSP